MGHHLFGRAGCGGHPDLHVSALQAAQVTPRPSAPWMRPASGLCCAHSASGIHWATSLPGETSPSCGTPATGDGTSGRFLSGDRLGEPGQWEPGGRSGALGIGDRTVARKGRASGWSLAVMGAGELGATAYAEAGLTAFEIGDEAILDMRTFSLNGPGMKARPAVRQPAATPWVHHDCGPSRRRGSCPLRGAVRRASRWRGDGGDERGFSMALGRLGDPLDSQCLLVEAHDADGALRAFLSFVPWGRNGLSLDLMRRDPHRRQRSGRADGGLAGRASSDLRRRSRVAELRNVPRSFRTRCRDRCRTDCPPVAPRAAARKPELAAGIPVPIQRQVPARMAASIHLLRVPLGSAACRHRRWQRRRLPDAAVAGDVEPAWQGSPRGCSGTRWRGVCGRGNCPYSGGA